MALSDAVADAVERFRKWVEDGAPGGWLHLNNLGVHTNVPADSNRETVLPAVLDELERLQAEQDAWRKRVEEVAATWGNMQAALATINPSREGE